MEEERFRLNLQRAKNYMSAVVATGRKIPSLSKEVACWKEECCSFCNQRGFWFSISGLLSKKDQGVLLLMLSCAHGALCIRGLAART